MAKLRKEMLVLSKPEHCQVIGSYLELQISDLGPFYMDGKVRQRPTTFMRSPRSKKAVLKSKLKEQRRSPKLSCSPDTIQCSAHILSSRCTNDLKILHRFNKTQAYNFHVFIKIKEGRFQVQIIGTTKKSEAVLQPRYYLVFSPYLEFQKSK